MFLRLGYLYVINQMLSMMCWLDNDDLTHLIKV